MKLLLAFVTIALGMGLPQLRAVDAAPQPGPEHKKLACFTGKWKAELTTVETPLAPAGKATATHEGRFVQGGFHVESRGKGRSPMGTFTWTEIYYYDSSKKAYGNFAYDGTGQAGLAKADCNGNTWTLLWEQSVGGRSYQCRSVVTFAPDGKSSTVEWTYSEDGTTWKPWLTGKAKRVGKAR